MKAWYAVHTQSRAEHMARRNLERQGYEVYLPQYLKRRRHARRTTQVAVPLFPRYLFVAMDVDSVRWRAIHSTIGVSYLICHGNSPVPVYPGVVEEIRVREDSAGMVTLESAPLFAKGEVVCINQGVFCDQVGLFECASDDERVLILLQLMGRQVKVRVPAEAVRAYA